MSTRDELAAWTTRDELIADLSAKVPAAEWDMANELGDVSGMADALIAEGWRKMPSREELADAIGGEYGYRWEQIPPMTREAYLRIADAVLALMDRGQ